MLSLTHLRISLDKILNIRSLWHVPLLFIKPSLKPGQHLRSRGNISEEQAGLLCTSNHNTVKYAGSEAKGQFLFFFTPIV